MGVGVDDVAKHHVANLARTNPCPAHGLADDLPAEGRGRKVLETATVLADRRANAAHHHNFTLSVHYRLLIRYSNSRTIPPDEGRCYFNAPLRGLPSLLYPSYPVPLERIFPSLPLTCRPGQASVPR